MANFIVLLSGRGSNLEAICNSGLSSNISCVISNNPDALGLQIAHNYSIPSIIINHKDFSSREHFEQSLVNTINKHKPTLIVLAGFMRILSPFFVNQYPQKIINIHPSLLPSFVGANAQQQAYNAKVKLSGATVHFVTDQLDHGPIIAQGVVDIKNATNVDDVAKKILRLEHQLYPFVIQKFLTNQISIANHGYVIVKKSDDDYNKLGEMINYIFY